MREVEVGVCGEFGGPWSCPTSRPISAVQTVSSALPCATPGTFDSNSGIAGCSTFLPQYVLTKSAALDGRLNRPKMAVQLSGLPSPAGVRQGAWFEIARLKFWKPSGAVSNVLMSGPAPHHRGQHGVEILAAVRCASRCA